MFQQAKTLHEKILSFLFALAATGKVAGKFQLTGAHAQEIFALIF